MSGQKAVALRYPENAEAPYIAACGKNEVARRIIEIAEENKIPLIKNVDMADVLSIQNPGDLIPPSTYAVIAEIFAFIRSMEQENGS